MISNFQRNQHFRKVSVNKTFTHVQVQKISDVAATFRLLFVQCKIAFTLHFQKDVGEYIVVLHCISVFVLKPKINLICFHSLYHSLSFVLPLVVIRYHSLSFIANLFHSLSLIVTHCTTRCNSLYYSLSLVVICCTTRCQLSLVVIRCHSLYHSLSLVVP